MRARLISNPSAGMRDERAEIQRAMNVLRERGWSINAVETARRGDATRLARVAAAEKLDALMVYGDEYRKENLRYVSNFWPIFERGACFIPRRGTPILAGAPEGERYAREMSAWDDVRNIKEFACVSVPEEIDYPLATFSSLNWSFHSIDAVTVPETTKRMDAWLKSPHR